MKKIIFIIAISLIGFTACQKEFEPIEPEENINSTKTITEANIDDNFNWKTSKEVSVTLEGQLTDVIKIKSSKGKNYLKAMLFSDSPYNTKITVPTYEEEVTLVYAGSTVTVPIVNKQINYNFK